METSPATQYIFAPANPIYHLTQNGYVSLCGRAVVGEPECQRRRDDFRIIAEKPQGQFVALCSKCHRLATGAPEHEPPGIDLLHSRMFEDFMP